MIHVLAIINVPAALGWPVAILLWVGVLGALIAESPRAAALFGLPALTLTLSMLA